jgi:hypothetical protein
MRKSSFINSSLIYLYFLLWGLGINPRIGVVCRIAICLILTLFVSPCFSMAYCIDDVIASELSSNSENVVLETKSLEPVSNKENVPTFIHHAIAISSLLIIGLVIIWRFSKGDSSVVADNPRMLLTNE